MNIHPLFVRSGNFPLNSAQFLCGLETFRQLSVLLGDLPSTSINFPCSRETFLQLPSSWVRPGDICQLPSTFRASGNPSVNICQLSVQLGNLPSTSVIIPCGLPSTSVDYSCGQNTFHQLSIWPRHLPSTSANLHASGKPSVKFC